MIDGKIRDEELDNDNRIATTSDLTTLAGDLNKSGLDDEKDVAAENRRVRRQRKYDITEVVRPSNMYKTCLRVGMNHQRN